jgi:hypothetical protein
MAGVEDRASNALRQEVVRPQMSDEESPEPGVEAGPYAMRTVKSTIAPWPDLAEAWRGASPRSLACRVTQAEAEPGINSISRRARTARLRSPRLPAQPPGGPARPILTNARVSAPAAATARNPDVRNADDRARGAKPIGST